MSPKNTKYEVHPILAEVAHHGRQEVVASLVKPERRVFQQPY